MKNQQGFAPIIIFLILVGLFVAGFLGSKYLRENGRSDKQVSEDIKTNKTSPTPAAAACEMSKFQEAVVWKTYASEMMKFQLEYPSNWCLSAQADEISITSFDQTGDIPEGNNGKISVEIMEENFKGSPEEWINSQVEDCKKQGGCAPAPPKIIETTNIGSKDALKTSNEILTELGGKVITYFLEHNGKLYQIDLQYSTETENLEIKKVFEKILSTFKFTQ